MYRGDLSKRDAISLDGIWMIEHRYIAILSADDNMGFGTAVGNMAGNGEFNWPSWLLFVCVVNQK